MQVEVYGTAIEEIDLARWDHVVEGSLHLHSGHLLVSGIMDDQNKATAIAIEPATYRARVYSRGLEGAIEGESLDDTDFYRIALWPGDLAPPRVLKAYEPS